MLCSLLLLLLSWQRYKHTLNSSTVIRRGTRAFLITLAITNRFNAYWASRASIENENNRKLLFLYSSRDGRNARRKGKESETLTYLFIYLFIRILYLLVSVLVIHTVSPLNADNLYKLRGCKVTCRWAPYSRHDRQDLGAVIKLTITNGT